MKAVILDAPVETAGVADRDVLLCSVEDMCHPGTLEVAHVQDRLPVPNDDPGTDLVTGDLPLLLMQVSPPRLRAQPPVSPGEVVVVERLLVGRPVQAAPPLHLQTGLPGESPAGLWRPGGAHVLQGGPAGEAGVVVGGGVGADVVVLLGDVRIPSLSAVWRGVGRKRRQTW